MVVLGVIVGVIAIMLTIGTVLQATCFKRELVKIKPYGQLVNVADGNMHVHAMGNGDKTIVLLAGMGVPLPSADFAPLMRKLSEKYTVVCVEYFGVGFSTGTSKPRICANYVKEIRAALDQAGFKAPYVLMPHSISNIYSEYFAYHYPNEVEAIISLDGTSSAYDGGELPKFVKSLMSLIKFQQSAGVISLLAALTVNKKKLLSMGYTIEEIHDMRTFAGFCFNDDLMEQMFQTPVEIRQVMSLPYPESVPYFKIIARDTYEKPNKQLKISPQEYQNRHLERIGKHVKYEILDGTHFIYQKNIERIADITGEFLSALGKQ